MKAQLPPDEALRIKSLQEYEILDSDPEAQFDEVTQLASQIAGTPIALISFVDSNRQWFKSVTGLDVKQTHRDMAFCAHAILTPDEVLVVQDAKNDVRFSNNPLVLGEPRIQFYAGAPLLASDGSALGTLCVIDTQPKKLTPPQLLSLQVLSRQVVLQLELRKEARKSKKLTELLNCVGSIAKVGGWELDVATQSTQWTPETYRIHELDESTLTNVTMGLDFYPPHAKKLLEKGVKDALNNQVPFDLELPFTTAKGRQIHVRAQGAPIVKDGKVTKVVGAFQDITDRILIQRALQKKRQRLELALENGQIGLWEWDLESGKRIASGCFAAIIGFTAEEFEDGCLWESLLHPNDKSQVLEQLTSYLHGERAEYNIDYRLKTKAGDWKWVNGRGTIIERAPDGAPRRMVGTLIDVDVNKRQQAQLEEAVALARAATKAKSEFLANMSHEIRTPMNGILGLSELLLDQKLTEDQNELARDIHFSAKSLLNIINDILDLSKVESGKVEINPVNFRLKSLIDDVLVVLKPVVEEKLISLVYDEAAEVPPYIYGDDIRIRQVLLNLIGNAVKFTPAGGGIFIQSRAEIKDHQDIILHFAVSDTGVGISAENAQRIFEPYVQAESGTTRQFGGTGLGLSVTRKLIELMDGRIWASGKEGSGSVFQFHITVKRGTAVESSATLIRPSEDFLFANSNVVSALLVEDNRVNQRLAKRLLEKFGCDVSISNDGNEALQQLADNPGKHAIVFMDCQMPHLDGYQATRKIRELEAGTGTHIPIIAMTANAMEGDKEKCLAAGMDAYLTKPIDRRQLAQVLEGFVAREGKYLSK